MSTEFRTVSFFDALYGFIFLIALWICSSVMFLNFQCGGGYVASSGIGVIAGFGEGKKDL